MSDKTKIEWTDATWNPLRPDHLTDPLRWPGAHDPTGSLSAVQGLRGSE